MGTLIKCVGLWFYEIWAVSVKTDFLSKWKHKPKHEFLTSVSKTLIIMSSDDFTLQCAEPPSFWHTFHTLNHLSSTSKHTWPTFDRLKTECTHESDISPRIHLFGIMETQFLSWGWSKLGYWWGNSTFDSPLCWQLLLNAWRLSLLKFNVVGLEDWNF